MCLLIRRYCALFPSFSLSLSPSCSLFCSLHSLPHTAPLCCPFSWLTKPVSGCGMRLIVSQRPQSHVVVFFRVASLDIIFAGSETSFLSEEKPLYAQRIMWVDRKQQQHEQLFATREREREGGVSLQPECDHFWAEIGEFLCAAAATWSEIKFVFGF